MPVLFVMSLLIGVSFVLGGVAVVQTPEAMNVSALAGLLSLTVAETNPDLVGGALICVGALAIAAGVLGCASLPLRLLMLIPAQIVVAAQLWSIGYAIWSGTYPDGYEPGGGKCSLLWNVGSCFILADQVVTFLVFATHTVCFAITIANPGPYLRPPPNGS